MKCYILAGGKGERLKPWTDVMPKSLALIAGNSIIDRINEFYCQYYEGVPTIICSGKDAEYIKAYSDWDNNNFVIDNHNGTAGSLNIAVKQIKRKEPFIVFNGDSIYNFNLNTFVNFAKKNKGVTIAVAKAVDNDSDYGLVKINKKFLINNFIEKECDDITGLRSIGVYYFPNKSYLDNSHDSLEYDTWPKLANKNMLYGWPSFAWYPIDDNKKLDYARSVIK